MSSIRKIKPKITTVLQQQSYKLQQKLSLLKQQLTQKKQQKSMRQTANELTNNPNPNYKQTSMRLSTTQLSKTTNPTTTKTTNQVSKSKNTNPNNISDKSNKNTPQPNQQLVNAMSEIKLQNLLPKLIQKGITNLGQLLRLNDQKVDQWKDFAVGWRIKLKKHIRKLNQDQQISSTSNSLLYQPKTQTQKLAQTKMQQNGDKKKEQQSLQQDSLYSKKDNQQNNIDQREEIDIEQIIKKRKDEKVFIPILRQSQELETQQMQQNLDYQEDEQRLIGSFMKAFHPRKPILAQQSKLVLKNQKGQMRAVDGKSIQWAQSVEQMERQFMSKSHKTYPKQTVVKEALLEMHHESLPSDQKQTKTVSITYQNTPHYQSQNSSLYCWRCFKKIENRISMLKKMEEQKYFCGKECFQIYSQERDLLSLQLEQ